MGNTLIGKSPRDSLSRARFFLEKARQCSVEERDDHEAFLEAAIVFGRTWMHRLQSRNLRKPGWKQWWDALSVNPSIQFLREQRNHILKVGPPKVGQIIHLGEHAQSAAALYYFETPQVPAIDTVGRHLAEMERLDKEAGGLFN